mmetsp:Transcript_16029/g.55965  ORF Transcript_16029/g.55965 Transcript_16029/m.55965 type:complete len:203 (+) Transcript_16029:418-1026(+)
MRAGDARERQQHLLHGWRVRPLLWAGAGRAVPADPWLHRVQLLAPGRDRAAPRQPVDGLGEAHLYRPLPAAPEELPQDREAPRQQGCTRLRVLLLRREEACWVQAPAPRTWHCHAAPRDARRLDRRRARGAGDGHSAVRRDPAEHLASRARGFSLRLHARHLVLDVAVPRAQGGGGPILAGSQTPHAQERGRRNGRGRGGGG